MELLKGTCHKLCMMCIPIENTMHLFGDSLSVINNTSRPKFALKKKNNIICCHIEQESVKMGESLGTQNNGKENVTDILMKLK